MNAALVFVCSNQVGPYINALSYLSDKRRVQSFTFVFITGAMTEGPQTAYVDEIIKAIEDLSTETYQGRPVSVDMQARAKYAALAAGLRQSSKLTEVVPLNALSSFLVREASRIKPHELFMDVTGLPKILTAHVMLIALVNGHEVHAFELRHALNRSRPEQSLYFALSPGSFDYPSLTNEPAVLNTVRQLVPLRRVILMAAALCLVGTICFAALLLIDPQNTALLFIGLVANVLGIAGTILQTVVIRRAGGP